jgi:hypothetical protein
LQAIAISHNLHLVNAGILNLPPLPSTTKTKCTNRANLWM